MRTPSIGQGFWHPVEGGGLATIGAENIGSFDEVVDVRVVILVEETDIEEGEGDENMEGADAARTEEARADDDEEARADDGEEAGTDAELLTILTTALPAESCGALAAG
jgi:hypothetical protein